MLKLIGDLKECIENYMPCSIVIAGTREYNNCYYTNRAHKV
jgi:hypothetical protein